MTTQEMMLRIICLEKSLKKANYRIFLLEKGKDLKEETQKFFEVKKKGVDMIQLDLFEAIGQ